ncbi:hypothetical protein B9Z55_020804 [Caenorhabditis nigoni]|uniref:Uncharacterized protein n=1 Tax=Caenorhabditis nigoni TaxID=1611254 RepID=A0A2G5TPS8_9PELO|nr:hypothetical protein B9Z55_020804 [Caenorhabditis nigoni]
MLKSVGKENGDDYKKNEKNRKMAMKNKKKKEEEEKERRRKEKERRRSRRRRRSGLFVGNAPRNGSSRGEEEGEKKRRECVKSEERHFARHYDRNNRNTTTGKNYPREEKRQRNWKQKNGWGFWNKRFTDQLPGQQLVWC